MKLYEVNYRKYNDDRTVRIVARSVKACVDKADAIVKAKYADRVVRINELFDDIEVAK